MRYWLAAIIATLAIYALMQWFLSGLRAAGQLPQ